MMLKQSSSRNLRGGRGYKIKHVAQMCLMLVVTLWMLYQLRHCYSKKAALEERNVGTVEAKADDEKVLAKLGRKGLLPGVVEEEEDEAKGVDEGRGDEFEQVDDMMEEIDEQEMDDHDKHQENQSEDVLAEKAHQEE